MSTTTDTARQSNDKDQLNDDDTQDCRQSCGDVEKQQEGGAEGLVVKQSMFLSLGILDRFLAVWIFLAMAIGIILGIGLILVGLGRCIAMVLIWTGLAGGDSEYCAILVAINSLLQMVLFAPLASVAVFLGIPLGAALTRVSVQKLAGPERYEKSLIGLLFTILVLFASQGRQVVHQIVSVVRVAAPLVVYFACIFFITLFYHLPIGIWSFTAASNNFELAIAVAVAIFGANSDQALASSVGPLIEVPVLLGLVYVVRTIAKRIGWAD
ncbi:hypothetical protein V1524DRAFT_472539 [Lipomyces starkeyi]